MGAKSAKARVVLFGGSFNPPQVGHTAICRWLIDEGLAREIWIIPCFIHPFGKGLAPFEDRFEMCRLAFEKLGLPLRILDIEKRLGGASFTLRTVENLRRENPGTDFGFVVGWDIEAELASWKDIDRIRGLVEIVKVQRGDGSHIPDVSSTEIRRLVREGGKWREMVEPEVADYIEAKGLYRD